MEERLIFDTGELEVWKGYIAGNIEAENIITWEPMPGDKWVYYVTRIEGDRIYGYRK
jgi:hypothetical protein